MTSSGPQLALLLLGSYRKMVDAVTRELAERGFDDVRPSLHYAMTAIDLGADSASDLGRALSISKQAAAKTIAALTARGWVQVGDDPADGRRKRLDVTDLGHRVMREGEQIFDELRRMWAAEIGVGELDTLERLLGGYVGNDGIHLEAPGWAEE